MKRSGWTVRGALCVWSVMALRTFAATVDFSDLSLPGPDTAWNGSDGAGGFLSNGVWFENDYDPTHASWTGFSYSNVNEPGLGGWGNQYAVYEPGVAHAGANGIYAVGYYAEPSLFNEFVETRPRLTLASPDVVLDLWINNTAYVAHHVLDGDLSFGVAPFDDGDWLRLTMAGLDDLLNPVGSPVEVYLADYRDDGELLVSEWTRVDLAPFGGAVKHMEFWIEGSQVGDWGLDTPAYFALDSVRLIPEPGAAGLALAGVAALAGLRRRTG